ncbi:MAG TPA: hypothetical protein VGG75_37405 [Trebonia sp.]|jgi:hypothetical protein
MLGKSKYPSIFTIRSGLGNPRYIILGFHQGEEFTIHHSLRSNYYSLFTGFNDVGNPSEMIVVCVGCNNSSNLGGKIYADATKILQSHDFATALISARIYH